MFKKSSPSTTEHENEDQNSYEKNPFEIHNILDIIVKSMSFDDLKNVRYVSNLWNDIGANELSKRSQNSITFETSDFGPSGKMQQILDLKRSRQILFVNQKPLNYTNFAIDINLLTFEDKLTQLFDQFRPKIIHIFGNWHGSTNNSVPEPDVQELMSKFLIKISPFIEEIGYSFGIIEILSSRPELCQNLTTIRFPNLRKISMSSFACDEMAKITLYSIIGQNSPNFCHLRLSATETGGLGSSRDKLKENFERTEFMCKLKIFEFYNMDSTQVLKIFTEFPTLKLKKFSYTNDHVGGFEVAQNFTNFLASQSESLEILEISNFEGSGTGMGPEEANISSYIYYLSETHQNFFQNLNQNIADRNFAQYNEDILHLPPPLDLPQMPIRDKFQFPILQRLTELQIGFFGRFSLYFAPLDFSRLFPQMRKFTTFDIHTFMRENIGHSGDLVKCLKLHNNLPHTYGERRATSSALDFTKIDQIFPKLKFLELPSPLIPRQGDSGGNLPFWRKIENVVVHFQLSELAFMNTQLMKEIKILEIDVDCSKEVGIYKDFEQDLENFIKGILKSSEICPKYFRINGHMMSEKFKSEFGNLFPKCVFSENN